MTLLIIVICLYTLVLGLMFYDNVCFNRRWRKWRKRLGIPTFEDKLNIALRDFIIAYESQIPEQLLAAYDAAIKIVESK